MTDPTLAGGDRGASKLLRNGVGLEVRNLKSKILNGKIRQTNI
jgi:hypothetical protein